MHFYPPKKSQNFWSRSLFFSGPNLFPAMESRNPESRNPGIPIPNPIPSRIGRVINLGMPGGGRPAGRPGMGSWLGLGWTNPGMAGNWDKCFKNLNSIKRPISAVADNIEVRNAKTIVVKTNQKIKFNLLYDKNRSLQNKIKIEQIRKEIS